MSEVQDAVQVIMVTGRTAYMTGRITVKSLSSFIKLINTIYLSKWKGSASLRRLRQIKGDDMVFINVSSEDRHDLSFVEKELKAHGILFSRMPDLCGGDGRTQYAVAASDLPKLKPMLLDHAVGERRNIMAGLISEQDYLSTGFGKDGLPTKEYSQLRQSAAPERGQAGRKTVMQEKMKGERDTERIHVSGEPSLLKVYDLQVSGRTDGFFWMDEDPVIRGDSFSLYPMGDGLSALLVPAGDEINPSIAGNSFGIQQEGLQRYSTPSMTHRAVIFKDATYKTIDLKTLKSRNVPGEDVIKTIQKGSIYQRNEQLKELLSKYDNEIGREVGRMEHLVRPGGGEKKWSI